MVGENLSKDACVIFLSSIAKEKGSYDPSYATAKAGLVGLQQSLAKANPSLRFNTISLGLVDGSPVQQGMTADFLKKHLNAMNGKLVNVDDVCKTLDYLIQCKSISSHDIKIDCGYRL
jgi:NAD(P)-dependent dehydrogenase (short-subunit alcohol dehydrogenase family)